MFRNKKDAENFFEFLNCHDKNIKFTLPKENNKIVSKMSQKIGFVSYLIQRSFKVSSSYIIFHNDLEKSKVLPQKNMYPTSVIYSQVKNGGQWKNF